MVRTFSPRGEGNLERALWAVESSPLVILRTKQSDISLKFEMFYPDITKNNTEQLTVS